MLVIGSSTGGPQALNAIVTQIGSVLDRAPVLITQHMPPTFTTILAEHLARLAKRPVREAVEGEEVNAGTIYLAPGGRHMSVARRDGIAVIALDDGPLVNFCKPAVDPLFSSAAEVWGPKVLALVLTGMGSDGLRGAQAIAAAGGSILAQDEADQRGVGHARPGRACRPLLGRAAARRDRAPAHAPVRGGQGVTPQDFDYLRQLLRQRSGLVLSAEKQYLAESRLLPVARKHGLAGLGELVGKLKATTAAAPLTVEVVEAMTTNKSFFFRDKVPFEHFRVTIMPALLAARAREKRIRIWCTACATGQEPYSLAMSLKGIGPALAGWRVEIVATDLVQRGAGEGQGRHLQPVRGAARVADPEAGEILQPGRRGLADRARNPRHGAVPPAQSAQRFFAARHVSTWCSAATC